MSNGANPYLLFLILILLVLGMDPEAGKRIEMVKNVTERVASAMNSFRSGMNAAAANFEEIHVLLRGLNIQGGGKE
jgi:hypothetical protein